MPKEGLLGFSDKSKTTYFDWADTEYLATWIACASRNKKEFVNEINASLQTHLCFYRMRFIQQNAVKTWIYEVMGVGLFVASSSVLN
jgi:hypothetical protein